LETMEKEPSERAVVSGKVKKPTMAAIKRRNCMIAVIRGCLGRLNERLSRWSDRLRVIDEEEKLGDQESDALIVTEFSLVHRME
jgi:hypothetical protein